MAIEVYEIEIAEVTNPASSVVTVTPPSTDVEVEVLGNESTVGIASQEISINYDVAYMVAGAGGGTGSGALQAHINSQTPHPAYDTNIVRLDILFENGLI